MHPNFAYFRKAKDNAMMLFTCLWLAPIDTDMEHYKRVKLAIWDYYWGFQEVVCKKKVKKCIQARVVLSLNYIWYYAEIYTSMVGHPQKKVNQWCAEASDVATHPGANSYMLRPKKMVCHVERQCWHIVLPKHLSNVGQICGDKK